MSRRRWIYGAIAATGGAAALVTFLDVSVARQGAHAPASASTADPPERERPPPEAPTTARPAPESSATSAPRPTAVAVPVPPPSRYVRPEPEPAASDEALVMAELRSIGESEPAVALELAREGNRRFRGDSEAPERAWFVVKSLVNLRRFDEARTEATAMVKTYPGTSWAADVERHLLSVPFDATETAHDPPTAR